MLAPSATTAALRGAVVKSGGRGGTEERGEMFAWLRRSATDAEVAVASAILTSSGDRRAEVLLEQFRRSTQVERRVDGSTMGVTVLWTTGVLKVDLDEDVVSDATTGSIVALARREELPVPAEVREFLEVTDGMLVGDWIGSLDC